MDEKILPKPQMLIMVVTGLYIWFSESRLSLKGTHDWAYTAEGFCRIFIHSFTGFGELLSYKAFQSKQVCHLTIEVTKAVKTVA
jgi:hypothetical protein